MSDEAVLALRQAAFAVFLGLAIAGVIGVLIWWFF